MELGVDTTGGTLSEALAAPGSLQLKWEQLSGTAGFRLQVASQQSPPAQGGRQRARWGVSVDALSSTWTMDDVY
jgi:hypothetical protein